MRHTVALGGNAVRDPGTPHSLPPAAGDGVPCSATPRVRSVAPHPLPAGCRRRPGIPCHHLAVLASLACAWLIQLGSSGAAQPAADALASFLRDLGHPRLAVSFDSADDLDGWHADTKGTWQVRNGACRGAVLDPGKPEPSFCLFRGFECGDLVADVRLRLVSGRSAYLVANRSINGKLGECWGKNGLDLARYSFPRRGSYSNNDLGCYGKPGAWLRFRLVALGGKRFYFTDDTLLAKATVEESGGNRLGLMTYMSSAEFDDLRCTTIPPGKRDALLALLEAMPVSPGPAKPLEPWQHPRLFGPKTSPFRIDPKPLSSRRLMGIYLDVLRTFICRYAQEWFTWRESLPAADSRVVYDADRRKWRTVTLTPEQKGRVGQISNAGYYRCPPDLNPMWLKWNNNSMSLGLAILLTEDPSETILDIPRSQLLEQAIAIIRHQAAMHVTGSYKGDFAHMRNGQWGRSWDSNWGVGGPGNAAWYLWDHLDPETRDMVERMVLCEADWRMQRPVRTQEFNDTQSDPDAWDTHVMALALNMFPDHPDQPRWRQRLSELVVNTFARPSDKTNDTVIDGRPVREWVHGANFHQDFTLENHGFCHPLYHYAAHGQVAMSAVAFLRTARPLPEAYTFALEESWKTLSLFADGAGEFLMPQGQDWPLHNVGGWPSLAFLGYHGCATARVHESRSAQYLRDRQALFKDGRIRSPTIGISIYEFGMVDWCGRAYLIHKALGGRERTWPTYDEFLREVSGTRVFSDCNFLVQRTPRMFASFSWKPACMGVVEPERGAHTHSPWLTWPHPEGLRGRYTVGGSKAQLRMVGHTEREHDDWGLSSTGEIALAGGALSQFISFTTIAPDIVVFIDRVVANRPGRLTASRAVTLGIENSEFNGNRRRLFGEGREMVVTGPQTSQSVQVSGPWANVDDRLGLVMALGARIAYEDSPRYRHGIIRDVLHGALERPRTPGRKLAAGETVAEHIAILLPGANADETRAVSETAEPIREDDILGVRLLKGDTRIEVTARLCPLGPAPTEGAARPDAPAGLPPQRTCVTRRTRGR